MLLEYLKSEHQRSVEDFMRKAKQELPTMPQLPPEPVRRLRANIILEEALETVEGLGFEVADLQYSHMYGKYTWELNPGPIASLNKTIDGCCDSKAVVTGTLSACGIPDLPFQELVDENNLAKFSAGHYLREDGKLIKPPDHKPPDIAGMVERLTKIAEEWRTPAAP